MASPPYVPSLPIVAPVPTTLRAAEALTTEELQYWLRHAGGEVVERELGRICDPRFGNLADDQVRNLERWLERIVGRRLGDQLHVRWPSPLLMRETVTDINLYSFRWPNDQKIDQAERRLDMGEEDVWRTFCYFLLV